MDFDMTSLGKAFELFRSAVCAVRDAKELLSDNEKRLEVESQIRYAEKEAQLAEVQMAQMAQSLGYHLCQCTFPPQVMLKVGHSGIQEIYTCSKCKSSWPPPYINSPKAITEYDPFR